MPEYHAARLTLSLLEMTLVYRIGRARAGCLLVFAIAVFLNAVADLLPMRPHDSAWIRQVWLPLAMLRLVASLAASLELLRFLYGLTLSRERKLLVAFAATVGLGLVVVPLALADWPWTADNWFQDVTAARQFALLLLAVGTSAAWWYVRIDRPVPIFGLKRSHWILWCAWLWVLFAMSSTGAGGLARHIGDWDHVQIWRWSNDILLVSQMGLIVAWLRALQSPPLIDRRARRL